MTDRPTYEGAVREALGGDPGLVEVERRGDVAIVRSYHATLDLYPSGRALDAAEAARVGLASEVVAPGAEVERALAVRDRVRALPAHAVAMTKPLVRAVADVGWHQALAMEEFAEPTCFTTEAHREGVRAVARRVSKAP